MPSGRLDVGLSGRSVYEVSMKILSKNSDGSRKSIISETKIVIALDGLQAARAMSDPWPWWSERMKNNDRVIVEGVRKLFEVDVEVDDAE